MSPLFLAEIDVAVLAITGGIVIAVLVTICLTLSTIYTTRQREQTRREIAAYVAEGSMTPDDGAKILTADPKSLQTSKC